MSQPDNMSSKKRRRLDKYIEKKLKKEERLELFEKLSKSQAEIPTTAHLQSSSTLGAGKPHTRVERQYEIQAEEQSEDLATETIPQEAVSITTGSTARKQARGDFKTWALSQLSTAKAYVAPVTIDSSLEISQHGQGTTIAAAPPPKRRKTESTEKHGPLGEDLQVPSNTLADDLRTRANRNAVKSIRVTRSSDVEDARQLLPIVSEEQSIMEAILLNPIVIICGETGSGKTTQVPQFLYEAGFGSSGSDNPGMIGVTQPRRVAAISMAARVGHELSLTSSCVSYQIRYDATVSPSTSIKFMTDGVLLRELATDLLLTKYSVIIVDEAHERSMNTDILIGVLSRVIKLREQMWGEGKDGVKPLRLIIMSATLRVSDFAENTTLFTVPPPIINISARQHPVTVHFNKRTVSDYVNEAVRKASKIHARLPAGGILIFLTGQNEITGVCRRLEARYGPKALAIRSNKRKATQTHLDAQSSFKSHSSAFQQQPQVDIEAEDIELSTQTEVIKGCDDIASDAEEDMEALDTDSDDEGTDDGPSSRESSEVPMHIVPLYSLLPSDRQMQVFQPPPEGSRLVVVATNIAETSLTIPGIRYVIDCGRAKERRYDVANGIQSFQISWISKASASQRAGRAGRTGPGHCYRLYSSAVFENYFDQFSRPEILRMPIESVVLQMKSMHIDAVVNFPFPTPPDRLALRQAETILAHLGALDISHILHNDNAQNPKTYLGGQITDLGRTMSLFPLSPRYSRMLVSARQHGCLPYVIAIVSALSIGDPFLHEEALEFHDEYGQQSSSNMLRGESRSKESRMQQRKKYFQTQQFHASLGKSTSDLFRILSVIGAYEFSGGGHQFCVEHFVRQKAMEEIHKLRAQISSIVHMNFPDVDTGFEPNLHPPSTVQLKVLRQLLAAGFIDHVAARKDIVEKDTASGERRTTSIGIPYRALGIEEDVYIHPSSVLASAAPPDYVVYHEIVRTSQIWLKGLTVINPAWLSSLGKSTLCTFSKPIKNRAGEMMVIPKFGHEGWELPPVIAPP